MQWRKRTREKNARAPTPSRTQTKFPHAASTKLTLKSPPPSRSFFVVVVAVAQVLENDVYSEFVHAIISDTSLSASIATSFVLAAAPAPATATPHALRLRDTYTIAATLPSLTVAVSK